VSSDATPTASITYNYYYHDYHDYHYYYYNYHDHGHTTTFSG